MSLPPRLVFVNAHFRFCHGTLKLIAAYWRRYPSHKRATAAHTSLS